MGKSKSPVAPSKVAVTPPAEIVTSPVPLGARAMFPLLEDMIEFPFTSSPDVKVVRSDGKKLLPL